MMTDVQQCTSAVYRSVSESGRSANSGMERRLESNTNTKPYNNNSGLSDALL